MKHNYKISLYQEETVDGLVWIAEYPELKYCAGSGDSPQEALEMAEKELPEHLEMLKLAERISLNKVGGHD